MRAKPQNIIATYATRLVILAVLLHVLLLLTAQQWAVVFPMPGSGTKNCQPATPRNCSGAAADAACPLPWVGEPAALNPLDCTPQLLILGAMRAGTTAAASYLNNSFHPAIAGISSQPGLQFFTQDRAELSGDALDAYLTSFPGVDASDNPLWGQCSYVRQQVAAANSSSSSSDSSSQQPSLLVRYEAGASYLAHPRAAGNVKAVLPQVRLLTLLREPLSRTLSHLHAEAQWRGSLSDDSEALQVGPTNYTKLLTQSMSPRLEKLLRFVAQLLQREMDVVRGCYNQYRPSMGPLFKQMDTCVAESMISNGFSRSSHIYQSLYGIHLERWFSIGSASQMLIWSASDFELAPLDHLRQLVDWLGLDGSGINTRQRFCAVDKRPADLISLLPPELIAQVARFYEPFNQLLFRVLRDNGFELLADRLGSQWRNPVQQWLDSYDSRPSTTVPLAALFAPELTEEELQQEGGQQAAGADQATDAAKRPRAAAAGGSGSSRSDAAAIVQRQPAPIKVQLAAQQQLLVNCAQLAATATQAVANVQMQMPDQLVISCSQLNSAGEEVATQQGRSATSLRMSTLGAADAPKLGGLVGGLVSALSGIGRSEVPLQTALPAAAMPAAVVPAAAGFSTWPVQPLQPLPYVPIFQTVTEKEEYMGRIARLELVVQAQREQLAAAKQQQQQQSTGDSSRPWPGQEDADTDADTDTYSENVEVYSDMDYDHTDQDQQTVDGGGQQQGDALEEDSLAAMQALELGGPTADASAAAGNIEASDAVAGVGAPLQVDETVSVGAH